MDAEIIKENIREIEAEICDTREKLNDLDRELESYYAALLENLFVVKKGDRVCVAFDDNHLIARSDFADQFGYFREQEYVVDSLYIHERKALMTGKKPELIGRPVDPSSEKISDSSYYIDSTWKLKK
jgi:hypothetical protein